MEGAPSPKLLTLFILFTQFILLTLLEVLREAVKDVLADFAR